MSLESLHGVMIKTQGPLNQMCSVSSADNGQCAGRTKDILFLSQLPPLPTQVCMCSFLRKKHLTFNTVTVTGRVSFMEKLSKMLHVSKAFSQLFQDLNSSVISGLLF